LLYSGGFAQKFTADCFVQSQVVAQTFEFKFYEGQKKGGGKFFSLLNPAIFLSEVDILEVDLKNAEWQSVGQAQ
jgi:hypothetical protein